MSIFEITKTGSNVLVKPSNTGVCLVRNTTVLLQGDDGGTILVENRNNNTRITLCEDDADAIEKVKENIPLKAALSGTRDENGHFYSDHSVVFDFEKVKNIAFAIDEDMIIQELIMLAEDNEKIFMEKENIDRLLDNIAIIAEVYSVAYIFRELKNFSITELEELIETEEPKSWFTSLVATI